MAFNKMFVMLPVMLAARKLDGEDPDTVYYLRIAYAAVQTVCVLVVAYTYIQATLIKSDKKVYVPPAPTPFADPNAPNKKYTETAYGPHVLSTARSLFASTVFGVCCTVGLHLYRKMVMGLAIQVIMAPLNLLENPLVKALFLGNGFRPEDKIFDEKLVEELEDDDEIVDNLGNPLVAAGGGKKKTIGDGASDSNVTEKSSEPQTLEEVMLDVWDAGVNADLNKLMNALTKKNCNFQTKQDGWTPFMVICGLANVKGTANAIQQLVELGGNPAISDKEGWNALHWTAFHGNVEAAKELSKNNEVCMKATDKDGYTPYQLAKKEKHDEISKLFEVADTCSATDGGDDTGIRKRK